MKKLLLLSLLLNSLFTIEYATASNRLDTVVFDMSNAIVNANTIDIPVYIKPAINSVAKDTSLDFSLKFNELNISYDSIIIYKSYIDASNISAYFNTADHHLRLSLNGLSSVTNTFHVLDKNVALFAVRFRFVSQGVCKKIKTTDLDSILTYLQGNSCGNKITPAPAFKVPVADFTSTKPCLGTNVVYSDASKLTQGSITSWTWNFGNDETSTLQNPATTYTNTGTYTTTLIVTSTAGCADTVKKRLYVNVSPTANFTSINNCSSGNIQFTDLSTISSGNVSLWLWNFGDNKQSTIKNPFHDYHANGNYTVSLTATSDSGCSATRTNLVAVNMLAAKFNVNNRCVGSTASFTDSSVATAATGAITQWAWDFGDGSNISTLQNPTNTYSAAGNYIVNLTISNQNCMDTLSQLISIEDKPVVKFGENITSGCMPLSVAFSDSSITAAQSTYLWDFGDASSASSSKNTAHTFVVTGIYTIKHYAITPAGCTDSAIQQSAINVYGPNVFFSTATPKNNYSASPIQFTNQTKGYTQWLWNFNDSTYSTDKAPVYTFPQAGKYSVCLTGKNDNGCSATKCDSITISSLNVVAIPQAFTPNGDNINDVLFVRGGPLTEMEFRVFNEWGNQLFFSDKQSEGWDGTYKGTPQATGAYEYMMKGKTEEGASFNLHGVINLIR